MAFPFLRAGSVFVCLGLLVLLMTPDVAVRAAPAQQGVERQLVLTVLDEDGAPMTDLETEQFVVLEDGAMRPVTASRVATEAMSIVLMVDMSQPPFGETLDIRSIRTAVSAFISTVHAAQPATRIQLVEVAGAATVRVKFSNESEELLESAGRLFQSQQGGAPMIEAVIDAARDLRGEENSPRRVIISVDRDSPDSSRVLPEDVTRAINDAKASIYAISIRAQGRGSAMREEMLAYLTDEFAGTMQTARVLTPLEDMLTRLGQALTSQYLVTYTRPNGVTVNDVLAGTTTAGKVLASELAGR